MAASDSSKEDYPIKNPVVEVNSLKDVSPQFNVDGVEDEDGYQFNHEGVKIDGYTKKDKNDMQRMGKKQELMVRLASYPNIGDKWLTNGSEKFPSPLRIELYCPSSSNMGVSFDVGRLIYRICSSQG